MEPDSSRLSWASCGLRATAFLRSPAGGMTLKYLSLDAEVPGLGVSFVLRLSRRFHLLKHDMDPIGPKSRDMDHEPVE